MKAITVIAAGLCQFFNACIHRPQPNPLLVLPPIRTTEEKPTVPVGDTWVSAADNDNNNAETVNVYALAWRRITLRTFDEYLGAVLAESDHEWQARRVREAKSNPNNVRAA